MGTGCSVCTLQALTAIALLVALTQGQWLRDGQVLWVDIGWDPVPWAPIVIANFTDNVTDTPSASSGASRTLLNKGARNVDEFISALGLDIDQPELQADDGLDKERFFQPNPDAAVNVHKARQAARKRREDKHRADKARQRARQGTAFPEQEEDAEEHFVQPDPAPQDLPAETEEAAQNEEEPQQPDSEALADSKKGVDGKEEPIPAGSATKQKPRIKGRPKSGPKKWKSKQAPVKQDKVQSDPTEGCKIFVIDLAAMAKREGIPECNINAFSTHPLTQRLLPNPEVADPKAEGELAAAPEELEWTFPFLAWPHNQSQHAAPWYLKETILRSPLHTNNISEATVILVDDYCYLTWAIADLNAKGHWWLDMHKHYKSDFKAGQHLLDLYHAMAHERDFMHKQGRNFLFATPLAHFDFGSWKIMEDYVGMACEHFSNSMHIVFDQVQRWRCGRYRPERTLVAPLSSTKDTAVPAIETERELTFVFRGSCDPDGGKDNQYAGVRLRRYLVRLFSKYGPDVKVSCTHEDKTGAGELAVNEHFILSHQEYMKEMGRSKFCIIIPGISQNSPRLTEAFLAGCVPVFIGPPWHAMPYPEVVNYKKTAVTIHMSDISRWGSFGAKWVLEKNAPRDVSRNGIKWWTPQVSAKDMEEMASLEDLATFLRNFPEETYQEKKAAVYELRRYFLWAESPQDPPAAADVAIQTACLWGHEEAKIVHMDI